MTTKTKTIQERVLTALESGKTLTAADIKNRYGAGNPAAVIQSLRFAGNPIFLNTRKNSKGQTVSRYVMGTKATRKVIGAGYKALAQGLLD